MALKFVETKDIVKLCRTKIVESYDKGEMHKLAKEVVDNVVVKRVNNLVDCAKSQAGDIASFMKQSAPVLAS